MRPVIEPPTLKVVALHTMWTLVMSALTLLPTPLLTEQVNPAGCLATVMEYLPPAATGVANLNAVAPLATLKSSPPLFCNTRPLPVRPAIEPPTLNVVALHAMWTLVISVVTLLPTPLLTAQVDPAGCVATVME